MAGLVATRTDLDAGTGEAFGARMSDGGEFVVAVSRDFVRRCPTPLAVLPGVDLMHPTPISHEIIELAPNVTTIDPWKETPELVASATEQVRKYLLHATN